MEIQSSSHALFDQITSNWATVALASQAGTYYSCFSNWSGR